MPKKITFIGGNSDGKLLEYDSDDDLPEILMSSNGTYFAELLNGGVSILKGERNSLWHSYSSDFYKKSDDSTTYQFMETKMIERCSAEIKGIRCMRPAVNEQGYCNGHS
tara:strand:+ start:1676 stop:2002 length:327 start_codon:yes stop_codon:yes gene_type:complete